MPIMFPRKIMGKNIDHTDTPTDNQVLTFDSTADEWNAQAQSVNTFGRVVKKDDETISNDTTLQDDDELFVALQINREYFIELSVFYDTTAVADLKTDITVPAGASGVKVSGIWTSGDQATTAIGSALTHAGTGAVRIFMQYVQITMGATAGNVQFRWAQNTGEVSNTIIKAGSAMIVYEELP